MSWNYLPRPELPGFRYDVRDLQGTRIGSLDPMTREIRPLIGGPSLRVDSFGVARDPIGAPVGHINAYGSFVPGLPGSR